MMYNIPGYRRIDRKWIVAPVGMLTLIVAAALLLSGVARAQDDTREITDERIAQAIETELLTDGAVASHLIDVAVNDGIVILSGRVANVLSSERAEKIAGSIRGVGAVVNDIEVSPRPRPDDRIREDVRTALISDPATDAYEVEASVDDGVVTLTGVVESWQEKQLSEFVASGVRGVREIRNQIIVNYEAERADEEIKRDIERRLAADIWVDDGLIDVSVLNGSVFLAGSVGSVSEQDRARADAWVLGVDDVNIEELEVSWLLANEMRKKSEHPIIDDTVIKRTVEDALVYDPRVLAQSVDVAVEDAIVVLAGTVDNRRARVVAGEDARNTVGVLRVRNFIKVRPEILPPDSVLEDRVRRALARDPHVMITDIAVQARNGLVFLNGSVNSSFEKEHAELIANRTKGVVDVSNNLAYEYVWAPKSDWEIQVDVREQMFWSPFVDENQVGIAVDDGVVTLTGVVDSWQEYRRAERNAFEAGAKDVRNKLTVSSFTPLPYSTTENPGVDQ